MTSAELDQSQETYSPGYGETVVGSYARRTVADQAAFFVPMLKPGMSLLDCGCGPGTITAGLAELLDPGTVVGIDIEPSQIDRARALARPNLSFQVASVYTLPFADHTFDAIFAHAVLQHLADPLDALHEMHRVLRPGGLIGVRDDDTGTMVIAPHSAKMDAVTDLLDRVIRASGGNGRVGRQHRALLRQAGFGEIVASATAQAHGTTPETAQQGEVSAALLDHMKPMIVEQGWASAERVEFLAGFCRDWGKGPDAFDVITWCEAVGRA
jgi:ubiquinone/menaquinone biosynthesis C-methylase UbiE